MKKLKAKQIVTIVIAALIGAGICAFPFIWNALHKPEKVAETVELPETSVKSTVNPDTPENLLPDGYFKGLDYGTGPFTPSTAGVTNITSAWKIPKSGTASTIFSVSFTENPTKTYNTVSMKMTQTPYSNVASIFCDIDASKFTPGETYTVSAYVIDGDGGLENTYTEYSFEMPPLVSGIGSFGQGNLAGYPITTRFTYNATDQTVRFTIGNINNYPGYYPETKIGAIKIEQGLHSTLQNDVEATVPEPDYDEGYKDGYNEGHEDGYQEGVEAGKEEGFQEGLDSSKYGIFAGASAEAKMDDPYEITLTGNLKFIKNGISLQSYAELAQAMHEKDERFNDYIVTITTTPYAWKDKPIYLNPKGNGTIPVQLETIQITLIGDDGKRYPAQIDSETHTTDGYKITTEYTGLVEKIEIQSPISAPVYFYIELIGPNESVYNDGYNDGYNAGIDKGIEQGEANAGKNYNSGYQAGLAAGRAEGSESSNFGELFTGVFGSLLAFFLTVGNGVTIWDISLFNIVISFVAILVIVKVVKQLI